VKEPPGVDLDRDGVAVDPADVRGERRGVDSSSVLRLRSRTIGPPAAISSSRSVLAKITRRPPETGNAVTLVDVELAVDAVDLPLLVAAIRSPLKSFR
jgi:hypothetical protein